MGNLRCIAWMVAVWAALLAAPGGAAADEVPPSERMVAKINEVRARHHLPAFGFSETLSGSSERFARWQMRTDRFGHAEAIRADGSWISTGEALEWHGGRRLRVRETVMRWMRSPSHAALLLNPAFSEVGAGVSRGRLGSRPATIWVLQLGTPAPQAPELPIGL
jgi:uncharacterized protein YkwD